jgi:hypothetical protein
MKYRHYTPEEIQFLKDNISGRSYKDMMEMFNRKFKLSIKMSTFLGIMQSNGIRNKGNNVLSVVDRRRYPIRSEVISSGYTMVKIANPGVWKKSICLFGKRLMARRLKTVVLYLRIKTNAILD